MNIKERIKEFSELINKYPNIQISKNYTLKEQNYIQNLKSIKKPLKIIKNHTQNIIFVKI